MDYWQVYIDCELIRMERLVSLKATLLQFLRKSVRKQLLYWVFFCFAVVILVD